MAHPKKSMDVPIGYIVTIKERPLIDILAKSAEIVYSLLLKLIKLK